MSTPNDGKNAKKETSPEDVAVGTKIKGLREERRMTQESFAKLLGLNLKTYQNYELGYRSVSKEIILALMEQTGVNPMWLLSGVGDKYLTESKLDPYTMAKTFERLTDAQRQELMLRATEMLELNEMKEVIGVMHQRFNGVNK